MYKADYHTHSVFSFDGSEELRNMCEAAIAAGLSEIAITDHVDIYTGMPAGYLINFGEYGDVGVKKLLIMDLQGLARGLEEVREEYRGRLKVLRGAELGQPQVNREAARDYLRSTQLDFVIGSVHNMEGDRDVYYYDFKDIDPAKLYFHYLDWLFDMTLQGDFDVMGHITYPLRYLYERTGKTLDMKPFEEKLRSLFRCLTERGRGIELNVSGLSKGGFTMPELPELKLYRECGGEVITVGSDAHKAQYIGAFIEEGQEMLRAAGFKYFTVFENRQPSFIPLD
ncbi:MAG: histidinol-phosphatase HisJ family protein [Lachnospiraceae bacterium]|nr:histidinol-phosphatase HisJ family protein [Lachnospiraceae bacterium]